MVHVSIYILGTFFDPHPNVSNPNTGPFEVWVLLERGLGDLWFYLDGGVSESYSHTSLGFLKRLQFEGALNILGIRWLETIERQKLPGVRGHCHGAELRIAVSWPRKPHGLNGAMFKLERHTFESPFQLCLKTAGRA